MRTEILQKFVNPKGKIYAHYIGNKITKLSNELCITKFMRNKILKKDS